MSPIALGVVVASIAVASIIAPRLIRRSSIRLVRRTQRELPQRFPAAEAQQRIAALEDLTRALKGEPR